MQLHQYIYCNIAFQSECRKNGDRKKGHRKNGHGKKRHRKKGTSEKLGKKGTLQKKTDIM